VLDQLSSWDRAAFYAINHASNRFFDWLMPILSDDGQFKIPFLIVFLGLLVFGKSKGRAAALLVIPLLAMSDQLSSNLIKNAVDRVRPCGALPDVRLLAGCGTSFSMPSSHAANTAAAAMHFALFYPRLALPLAVLALGVGYSRVYLGMHYPGDVLVGFLVGAAAALTIQLLYRVGLRIVHRRRAVRASHTPHHAAAAE
jgi:undecaprenyl-diphosphatase